MYSPKPIPRPFQGKPQPAKETPSVLIEAKEKSDKPSVCSQNSLSPLAALLFLDLFAKQKDG